MGREYALIGACSGWGAQKLETELGPSVVFESEVVKQIKDIDSVVSILPDKQAKQGASIALDARLPVVEEYLTKISLQIERALIKSTFPVVIGGDHSCAIATWSKLAWHYKAMGEFGLLWFDAHMDSHTLETTPSRALHGMPLAALLGHGCSSLTGFINEATKLSAKHVVLYGIRSFEPEEEELLKSLNVRVFRMEEIQDRGLDVTFQEAMQIVSAARVFGVSIDLDGFDPEYVPGVGSRATGGIIPEDFIPVLASLKEYPNLKGLEIVEFNPTLDSEKKTLSVIEEILQKVL